ncbi:hypothetical protein HMP0721_2061 [Pseudoramibacter alactolyticus ATCC 23263]|uniref:Uncharacterized protein n=2 Tax=Pseudoramibacter TaxID=113286 RepID=E6MJ76_9FIRM|nr:hypothetical protein HMP0721_2061 [Pseudoramibacter alactolyticus ATCC 23263]
MSSMLANLAFGLLLLLYGGGKAAAGTERGVAVFCCAAGGVFVLLGVVWLIRWLRAAD